MSTSTSSEISSPAIVPEGRIPFTVDGETHETWYRIYGDLATSKSVPLVVIHGGKPRLLECIKRANRCLHFAKYILRIFIFIPTSRLPMSLGPGMAHGYLLPVSALEETRPVIFYDQLGNNRSTHLREKPASFWTIDLFINELINLIEYLGISSRYDILGHSWGGMLASEFIIRRQPTGLRRLVIVSSLPSVELWNESNKILKKELPQDVQDDFENGPRDMVKYRKALEALYSRHGCIVKDHVNEIYSAVLDPIFGNRETGEGGNHTVTFTMCVSCEGILYIFLILCATGTRGLFESGTSLTTCTRSTFPLFC